MSISDCFSQTMVDHWANLLCFLDHRRGGYSDLSSFARTVTPTATGGVYPQNQQDLHGRCISMGGTMPLTATGRLVVSASADFAPTAMTVVFFARLGRIYSTNVRLAEFRSAGGSYIDIYANTTTSLAVFDPAGNHPWTLTTTQLQNLSCFAVKATNGAQWYGYHNGSLLGAASTNSNIPGGVSPAIHLYNYNTGSNADPWWKFYGFLMFNTQLTDAEISRLHDDWLLSRGALR